MGVNRMGMLHTVVFDIDSTIADPSHRMHMIRHPMSDEDWCNFTMGCHDDAPIWEVIYILNTLYCQGVEIQFWTGRTDRAEKKTRDWIAKSTIIIGPDYVLKMRSEEEMSLTNTDLKEKWLLAADPKPDLVFEDCERNVAMFRRYGIRTLHVTDQEFGR